MPAVLSLPVELLLDVFSLASPKSPSQDFSVYSSRQRDLRSFSLVHRTWTSIAQAVLEEEIWVDRRTRFETSRRSRRIIKDLKGTKYLTVGHSYRSVLASRAVSDGWAGLKYLLYVTDKMFSNVGLAEFARLPSESLCYTSLARFADACSTQCADLETLHFDGGLIENDISDDQLTFHHLRRLTFGSDARFRDTPDHYKQVFSPARMPNLVHLSFDVNSVSGGSSRVLDLILPQVEALALLNDNRRLTHLRLTGLLARARSLKHLTLPKAFNAAALLLDDDFSLGLESFHLPIRSSEDWTNCEWLQATRNWLVGVAIGTRRNVTIDRIVIYGSKREALETWPTPEFDLFEWREDWRRLAVEQFDGR